MGEMKRKILFFTAPGKVELREEVLPPLNPNEVLVETVCSALSAGTEMLVYRGQLVNDTFEVSDIPAVQFLWQA